MSLVAVTGGSGFLGRETVSALVQAGHRVRVLDLTLPAVMPEEVEYVGGDVTDPTTLAELVAGADVVLHGAFASPHADVATIERVNVLGTRNLLDAAAWARVARVVVVSSTIVGRSVRPHPLLPSAPASRLAAYRWSRMRAELAVSRTAGRMATAVVRPKTFIGPGQVGGYALVMRAVAESSPVPIFGPGTNRYQLVDVRDLADGLRRLVESDATGVFGFGAARFGTVAEDLQALIAHAGSESRLVSIPRPVGRAAFAGLRSLALPPFGEWHESAILGTDNVVDITRATVELGWSPTRSNAEALCDAYDWAVERSGAATTHPIPRSHVLARRALNRALSVNGWRAGGASGT